MRARPRPPRPRRARTAAVVAAALALLLGACGTGVEAAPTAQLPVGAKPLPAGVSTVAPSAAAPSAESCDVLASLRPSGALPAPGAMPAGSTMRRIEARGYLIAGVDDDSYLFGYRNPSTASGAPPVIGFDIDVVHAIAQAIFGDPNRVRFKIITQSQRVSAVTSGQVDIVADSMTITCDRKQSVAFSTDYFDAGQRILVDDNSSVANVADLAGRKVCAVSGTTSIQTLAEPQYRLTPISAATWTDCLVMLQQGEVDAVSTDDSILVGLQEQDPYTKIVGPRFTSEPHGLAMPLSEPDFVRFVNAVLEQMRTDGVWTRLYQQWIGPRLGPVPAPPQPTYQD